MEFIHIHYRSVVFSFIVPVLKCCTFTTLNFASFCLDCLSKNWATSVAFFKNLLCFFWCNQKTGNEDCKIDIKTEIQTGRPRNRGFIPGRGNRFFSTSNRPYQHWDKHNFLQNGYRRLLSRKVKQPFHEPFLCLLPRKRIPPPPQYSWTPLSVIKLLKTKLNLP
jgi:hypothetical protein